MGGRYASYWNAFLCKYFWLMLYFLPPANEVCEGYVFTPVCQTFCSQGGCLPQCILGYTNSSRTRPPPTPPRSRPPGPDPLSRRLLLLTVRIILKCILSVTYFMFLHEWSRYNFPSTLTQFSLELLTCTIMISLWSPKQVRKLFNYK